MAAAVSQRDVYEGKQDLEMKDIEDRIALDNSNWKKFSQRLHPFL